MYRLRPGLGDTSSGVLAGNDVATCNSGWYWFLPFCWEYSPSAWSEAAQFSPASLTTMPVSPAAVSVSNPSAPAPLTAEEAAQQTSASLNAAALQTQANNLAASQNQPTVCDSGQVLNDDGVCVDAGCSLFGLPCWGLAAIAGLTFFAFAAIGGGSARRYGR